MKKGTLALVVVYSLLLTCCSEKQQLTNELNEPKNKPIADNSIKGLNTIKGEKITYDPKQYEETIEDSILNAESNLRLFIKNYTLLDQGIDTVYEFENGIKERFFFRDKATEIKLTLKDSIIYSKTFKKENLPEINIKDSFGKTSLLHRIWLDNYNKENSIITLFCTVCVSDSDWCNIYKIFIDKEGKQKIVLAEQT